VITTVDDGLSIFSFNLSISFLVIMLTAAPESSTARIHFDEQKLLLKHDGRRIEVPISNSGTKKLEVPEERDQLDSDSGDEFGEYTYENEELVEAEGYYTEETSEEDNELFYNPWEEVTSPAIYLMSIEEVLAQEDTEVKLTVEEQIEKFLQNDALDKEEKEKAETFFQKEINIFTNNMQGLSKTTVTSHRIDTGGAKPIKQRAYRAAPNEHEFIEQELKELEERGLIQKSSSPWALPVVMVPKK
ncbi:12172_t:CDS:1, partial [Ambispora leptoticha]